MIIKFISRSISSFSAQTNSKSPISLLEKTTLGDITELAALKEQMTADAAAAKEENKD